MSAQQLNVVRTVSDKKVDQELRKLLRKLEWDSVCCCLPCDLTWALSLLLPFVPPVAKPLPRFIPDWAKGPTVAEPVPHAEPLWQEGVQFLPPVLYPAPGCQAPAQSLGEQQPPKVDC